MSHVVIDTSSEFNTEVSLTLALADEIDSPRARLIKTLIQHGLWQKLVDLRCDPSNYEDVRNFADDYLITNVMRKSPNIPLEVDRVQRAVDAFLASEKRCAETNQRLLDDTPPEWWDLFRKRIYGVLGPFTKTDARFIEQNFRFGPGATTGVKGYETTVSDKIVAEMHMTEELLPFWKSMMGERWVTDQTSVYKQHSAVDPTTDNHQFWTRCETVPGPLNKEATVAYMGRDITSSLTPWHPVIVKGGVFFTVPKDAEIDRGCIKEPTLNVFGQTSCGSLLKTKLRNFGLNLNKQADVNRKLAQKARDLRLCTIDLSQASDTVCWALIFLAFPPRWFEILDLFRSKYCTVEKGKDPVELEKFSSMGNGFTFEIETVVFYCLALTVVPQDEWDLVSVFGDDIIIPRDYASEYIRRLAHLGMQVNGSKSFLAGNFFESCGTDWFKGYNVRPFFLKGSKDPKEEVKGNVPYVLRIANKLRLYAAMRGLDHCDARFRPIYNALKAKIPHQWNKTKVPWTEGDVGIITAASEVDGLQRHETYDRFWYGQAVMTKPVLREFRSPYRLIASCLQKANTGKVGAASQCQLFLDQYEPKLPPTQRRLRIVHPNKYMGRYGKKYVVIPYSPTYPQGRRLRKCDLDSRSLQSFEETRFTRNCEPIRGLYGKVVTELRPMFWAKDGLTWA